MSDFEKAVKYVQNLPKGESPLSNEQKLQFYANYKIATVGSCIEHGGSQPWAVQIEARSKWDAWNALGNKSKEDAEKDYVSLLDKLHPEWRN